MRKERHEAQQQHCLNVSISQNRRLIDKRAAVVYLEVTVHVQNALGETVDSRTQHTPDWTLVSRFTVPERAVRLVLPGEPEPVAVKSQQGAIEAEIVHYLTGTDSGSDKEDPVSKSTAEKQSFWHGMHWAYVLGVTLMILGACVVLGALISMVIANLRDRRLRSLRYHGDYGLQRRVSSGNSIRDLFTHASFQGLVGGGSACSSGKDPRYMV